MKGRQIFGHLKDVVAVDVDALLGVWAEAMRAHIEALLCRGGWMLSQPKGDLIADVVNGGMVWFRHTEEAK